MCAKIVILDWVIVVLKPKTGWKRQFFGRKFIKSLITQKLRFLQVHEGDTEVDKKLQVSLRWIH